MSSRYAKQKSSPLSTSSMNRWKLLGGAAQAKGHEGKLEKL
jgi:hypothetical protein